MDELAEVIESIVDTTTAVDKMHYENRMMSSLLARVATVIADDTLNNADKVDTIRILMQWYDAYQAGVYDANITGSKLGSK